MQDTIVTFYCVCDDLLKALDHQDDSQTRFSSAEVMTVPLTACAFFGGNMALARNFLHSHGYTRYTLSASRFSRRLAALPAEAWSTLFALLGHVFKQHNHSGVYVVDSLPVPVCDNPPKGHPASSVASCFRMRRIVAIPPASGATSMVSKCIC